MLGISRKMAALVCFLFVHFVNTKGIKDSFLAEVVKRDIAATVGKKQRIGRVRTCAGFAAVRYQKGHQKKKTR